GLGLPTDADGPSNAREPRKHSDRRTAVNRTCAKVVIGATLSALVFSGVAWSAGPKKFKVTLDGYEEDPLALSTTGTGTFDVKIDDAAQEITYELSYSALEGEVTQAHIHLGKRSQSGGII